MQQVMKPVPELRPFNLKGDTVTYVALDYTHLYLFIVEFSASRILLDTWKAFDKYLLNK